MIAAKLSLLLAAASVASPARGEGEPLTGYIMDKKCAYDFDCPLGTTDNRTACTLTRDGTPPVRGSAPDGAYPFYNPQDHTGWCLLIPKLCVDSGYTLMSKDPADPDNDPTLRHEIIANFTDDASNEAVREYIRKVQPNSLEWAGKASFPLVTVVPGEGSATEEGGMAQIRNAVLKDPWDPAVKFAGAETTQTACYDPADADVEKNNMCFRSDVDVSKDNIKKMIVIESNGCPDHVHMEGSPGKFDGPDYPKAPAGCGANACGANACGANACGANACGANACGAGLSTDECPANLKNSIEFDPSATLRYKVTGGKLRGCLEVKDHDGWVGFGIRDPAAKEGVNMDGADAVIGIPAEGTVMKYDLSNTATAMDPNKQTLEGTSIVTTDDGRTIMQFTKLLEEDGENPIKAEGVNTFLHARGDQTLNYHTKGRFVKTKDFSTDPPAECGLCGANACGANACGANACGANACGANACGANACGANACGANACGANACGANACGANACGANACGAQGRRINACGAQACGAQACGANACGAQACGANACGANACGANACGAQGCNAQGYGAGACSASEVDACSATLFDDGKDCDACGAGKHCDAGIPCDACGADKSCDAGNLCDACGAGKPCGACGPCGGCGCGGASGGCDAISTFDATYQHYTMTIPQEPGTPGEATLITGDVVGIMTNGVLLDSHDQTWHYDKCNGHSDMKHHYHYHIPPICYLNSMGVPTPNADTWYLNDAKDDIRPYQDMAKQFPETGKSPVVGFARDGFPIYALYGPNDKLVKSHLYGGDLDECNGKAVDGKYAYYISAEPPFVPTCLRGKAGSFAFAASVKKCPAKGVTNKISGLSVLAVAPSPTDPASTPDIAVGVASPVAPSPTKPGPTQDTVASPESAAHANITLLGLVLTAATITALFI